MDRFALRSLNLAFATAILSFSAGVLAQEAPVAPAPAADAPAADAPAAPPEPAPAAAPEPAPMADIDPVTEPAPAPADAKPKPPPYSLPWQLRPVVVGNV